MNACHWKKTPLTLALLTLAAPALACDAPPLETLLQLAGDWRLSANGEHAGTLVARPAAAGCALVETWQGDDGSQGVSLHWYDAANGELRQIYVNDAGGYIAAEGTVQEGILEYRGTTQDEAGKEYLRRATLHGLGTDEIVQVEDVSEDDGATWRQLATVRYTRVTEEDSPQAQ